MGELNELDHADRELFRGISSHPTKRCIGVGHPSGNRLDLGGTNIRGFNHRAEVNRCFVGGDGTLVSPQQRTDCIKIFDPSSAFCT
jgi:hypothetical protein